LSNGDSKKKSTKEKTTNEGKSEEDNEDLATKDYQLFEALNLLKGLSIARQLSKK
jgi:hypothetical protein